MYEYVEEKVIKPYRQSCSHDMVQLRDTLNKKYNIITQFSLVGSGGASRNMVTRNGSGPFDLDYNLQIISMPQEYYTNLQKLKDIVRDTLNKIEGHQWFSDAKDSTSVLTTILHFTNSPEVKFSFDIAILCKNRYGNWCRLIHNKHLWGFTCDQYTWNEVLTSSNVDLKAIELKEKHLWNEVRDTYLYKKNIYLYRGDHNHPSYVIYVETINEVYQWYLQKKII